MGWDDPERVLYLAAEALWEAQERAAERAQHCGCHACRQSLAELSDWLCRKEPATVSDDIYDDWDT